MAMSSGATNRIVCLQAGQTVETVVIDSTSKGSTSEYFKNVFWIIKSPPAKTHAGFKQGQPSKAKDYDADEDGVHIVSSVR